MTFYILERSSIRVSTLEIDPDILATLRRLEELPCRFTVVFSSGLYIVDRIESIDDTSESAALWQTCVHLECRDSRTHQIPIAHIRSLEVIGPSSGFT